MKSPRLTDCFEDRFCVCDWPSGTATALNRESGKARARSRADPRDLRGSALPSHRVLGNSLGLLLQGSPPSRLQGEFILEYSVAA